MTRKTTNSDRKKTNDDNGGRSATDIALRERAYRLGLHGLLAHWDEVAAEPWIKTLLDYEEAERTRRSLERAGVKIVGSVLNRRRSYIPAFLEEML